MFGALLRDGGMYVCNVILKLSYFVSTDYVCGSSGGDWSKQYTLRSVGGADWSPTLAVYGDMGTANAVSLPWLVEEATTGGFDAVLHVGDFAYDLFSVRLLHTRCWL